MRVPRRTVRHIEYIKGLLQLRTGDSYSLDDVVWEALNIAYGDDLKQISEKPEQKNDKTE
jgi:hypothetical protein